MEGIKASMLSMKKDTEKANDKADAVELLSKQANARVSQVEKELSDLLEYYSKLDAEYKKCQEDFQGAEMVVSKTETDLTCTQLKVNNLQKRIQEIDEAYEICEKRLKDTLDKLVDCTRRADESDRIRRVLESGAVADKMRFKQLETQIAELNTRAEKAELKIEEAVQLITLFEEDLDFVETKATNAEIKLLELQEEMEVVGNNLKSFQVSAEKSRLVELEFKKMIKDLQNSVKKAEARAIHGERHVETLLEDIDMLTANLKAEKDKLKKISFEMELTLAEFK